MRRLAVVLAVLLVASSAWAGQQIIMCGFGGIAYSCSDDNVTGILFQERFECGANTSGGDADQEQVWTAGGTPSFTDTTAPVLQGTEGALFGNTNNAYHAVDNPDIYVAFKMNYASLGGSTTLIALTNGANNRGSITWNPVNGKMACVNSGGTTNTTAGAVFATSTTYYVKIRATTGTGADAVVTGWTSSDGASWTQQCQSTNGTWTDNVTRIYLPNVGYQTLSGRYDDVRGSTSDINY